MNLSILGGNTVPSRMDKKMRKEIKHLTALLGAISLVVPFGTQMATGAETNYPDMEVGVFWNSDSDRSDTVYCHTMVPTSSKSAPHIRLMVTVARMFLENRATSMPFMIRVLRIKMGRFGFLAAMCKSNRIWDGVLPR